MKLRYDITTAQCELDRVQRRLKRIRTDFTNTDFHRASIDEKDLANIFSHIHKALSECEHLEAVLIFRQQDEPTTFSTW